MRAKDEGVLMILFCSAVAVVVLVFTPFGRIVMDYLNGLLKWLATLF